MKAIWIILSFACFYSLAQEGEEFDLTGVEKVEVTEGKEAGFWRRFSRSFTGSVGQASIIGTGDDYRGYTHARLGFEYSPFSTTKIGLKGLYEKTQIQFMQELKESPRNTSDMEKEKKLDYDKDNFRAEEAYLSQEIFDGLTLSYGIQQIVWGQLEPYSPTNLVFPFNLSTTDVEFTKVKGTLPQEAGVATFFPVDSISLSLYYFPQLTYDKVVEKRMENKNIPFHLPSGSDKAQEGARLMFYPSWGTVGFSYYDGFNTSLPHNNDRILESGGTISRNESYSFAPQEMFGFEVAIPVGSWVHKFEYSIIKSIDSINFNYFGPVNNIENEHERELYNIIMNENDGSLNVNRDQHVAALGTTADLDKWYFNLMLFYIEEKLDERGQRLVDLKDMAYSEDNDDSYDGPIFPGAVISRYLDGDKTSEVALAAGIIGNGAGLAIFYKKTTDSFVFGAGLQRIEYFSDDAVIEDGGDEDYEKKDDITLGLLLSASYKF